MDGKTHNELLIKAVTYNYPEEIPVSIGILPAVLIKYGDAVHDIIEKYPGLYFGVNRDYDPTLNLPATYHTGQHIDAWGCVWSNIQEGMESMVT